MEPICLIRYKQELRGTCYFEFLPGEYRNECWNEGSVFLAEEVFGLIEPIFARHEPNFDHFSFVGIQRPTWERIISDLEVLVNAARSSEDMANLRGAVGFTFTTSEKQSDRNFRVNADTLANMAEELIDWLREQLRQHECVSVLGM
jgi:hypothetical protein